jgi:hypothetical protein
MKIMLLWIGSHSVSTGDSVAFVKAVRDKSMGGSVSLVRAVSRKLTNDFCVPPLLYGFVAWCCCQT